MADKHTPEMTKNHRARAREKLVAAGRDAASPELVLEVFLYDLLPRIDTYPVAHRLLEKFGTLQGVFSAPERELVSVRGIGKLTAKRIVSAGTAIGRAVLERFTAFPLDTEYKIFPVVSWLLRDAAPDCKLMIALGDDMKYTSHVIMTPDAEREETERFVRGAVSRGAARFIFAHKHPEGCSDPSAQDIASTDYLYGLCEGEGAPLAAHYIVTDAGFFAVPAPGEEK